MNEFVKKFYWLIFTAVFSLFIFLINTSAKRIGNIELHNPFNYNEIITSFSDSTEKINSEVKPRWEKIQRFRSFLDSSDVSKGINFEKLLTTSLENGHQIHREIFILEVMIYQAENINYGQGYRGIFIKKIDQLNGELKIWEKLGDYSVIYLSHPDSFDPLKFKVDFIREYDRQYDSAYSLGQVLLYDPGILSPFIPMFIDVLLIWCIVTLVYVIVMILLPAGLLIWKEKTDHINQMED